MAARNFVNQQFTMERKMVTLFSRCVGAAAADPTGLKGKGISSITHSTTGTYVVTFDAQYSGLLFAGFSVIDTGTIDDWEVTLDTDLTGGNTLTIVVFNGGTATNLPATATLLGQYVLSNTAAEPTGY